MPPTDYIKRFKSLISRETELISRGYSRVAGIDEAGRGPLAGPVVAAACVSTVPYNVDSVPEYLTRIYDSKKLSEKLRAELYSHITADDSPFHFGIGISNVECIDSINILNATHKAMAQAVTQLTFLPDYILIDGTELPDSPIPQEKIIRGDSTCLCIAAASIIAKETRDTIMREYAQEYPHYGFDTHKGYGTATHIEALHRHGRCPIHRRSFRVAGLDKK